MNQMFSNSSQSFGPRRSGTKVRDFDPRPESPGQLAIAGLVVLLLSAVVPVLHVLGSVGLVLLLVAGLGYLIRPRSRTMYWRERKIDLDDEPGPAQRVYRALFKR